MKETFVILCVSIPCVAVPAEAANVPAFDIQKYCKQLADYGGGSYSLEKSCQDMELAARNNIAERNVEARIMKYCVDLSEYGGASYSLLESCIDMEEQAKQSMQ